MELDRITARVRPRNPYEATDLGIVMARRWFRPLMLLWLLPSLPLMLVLFAVFHSQPLWALLILWWLKPLFETLQLQFVAEALFNPEVRWRDIARRMSSLLRHQWLAKLLLQRWSLSRSFNMPVGELERLKGKQRSQRLSTLHRGANAASIWLTLLGAHLEAVLVTALFLAAWMLVPVEMSVDFEIEDLLNGPLLFPTLAWSGYLAMWIISPFYVCGGFMQYINRRTWLEAWDIELTFRHLAARHAPAARNLAALVLAAMLLLPLAHSLPVHAETADNTVTAEEPFTPEQSQNMIGEVLESDDFNQIETRKALRWVDEKPTEKQDDDANSWQKKLTDWFEGFFKDSPTLKGLLNGLAQIPQVLEVLLWGLVITLFALLIYRFREFALPGLRRDKKSERTAPTHLFGLELNQASLPDDVTSAARALWQQQRSRDALGLLYRAALSYLVFERELPLEDCHTEDECVALCRHREPSERATYFQNLTSHWVRLAYAHQTPDDAGFQQLCEQWPAFAQEATA